MENVKKTALFNMHEKYMGKIIDFSGWALPVQYSDIQKEHEAVRTSAGLFDVSHMGEVEITGPQSFDFIQNLITNDLSNLNNNQTLYTFMCYPNGGVVDDLIVYKHSNDNFLLVINAANIEKDYQWMVDNKANYNLTISNKSNEISQIAIQGPKAENILQKLTNVNLEEIKFFYFMDKVKIAGAECLVSRTGYTGEDGFEIYTLNENAEKIWEALMKAGEEYGILPAGLGCRDTLRFEAALPLYGNELSKNITPLEANLGFFVKLDKDNFIGKDALTKQKKEGLQRKIIGFELIGKGIPRHGYEVYSNDEKIGVVTTGYLSPTVGKAIGLALIDFKYTALETHIQIKIRKKFVAAKVISKKFYTKKYKK
ncbi:glycine cleavage system aminomethyltransferase GcvT [Clostridium sp. DL1XJH146]